VILRYQETLFIGESERFVKKALEMGYCLYRAPLGNLEEGSFSGEFEQ
jgi:hypothetical protein